MSPELARSVIVVGIRTYRSLSSKSGLLAIWRYLNTYLQLAHEIQHPDQYESRRYCRELCRSE